MSNKNPDFEVPGSKWKAWLFNPFMFIAGTESLVCGAAILFLSALLGYVCGVRFDGVLDIHKAGTLPMWFFFFESAAAWLSLAVVLCVFGKFVYSKSVRAVDVFGTQALARWPYMFTPLILLPAAFQRMQETATNPQAAKAFAISDLAIVLIGSVLLIAIIIWTVYLMYKAFSVSCNAKGPKAIALFALAIVISEVMSKVIIAVMYVQTVAH